MTFRLESYKSVTDSDLTWYNEFKPNIEKEIREKHAGIPDDFELKPVTYLARQFTGLNLTYKVALPNNKFVEVKFSAGDIIPAGASRPPVSFYISDTLSSTDGDDD